MNKKGQAHMLDDPTCMGLKIKAKVHISKPYLLFFSFFKLSTPFFFKRKKQHATCLVFKIMATTCDQKGWQQTPKSKKKHISAICFKEKTKKHPNNLKNSFLVLNQHLTS